jgi:plasmid stabilization system protein ParE
LEAAQGEVGRASWQKAEPMTLRSVLRPRAQADIEDAYAYYVQVAGIEVADRFIDGVVNTLESISANPSMGSPRH